MPDKDRQTELYCDELRAWENDLREVRDVQDLCWSEWMIGVKQHLSRDRGDDRFLSKVRVPYGFHAVEVIVPRIVGEDVRLSYKPAGSNSDELPALIHTGLATYQLERMAFDRELRHFCRIGCITGLAVAKVGWVQTIADVTYEQETPRYTPEVDAWLDMPERQDQEMKLQNSPFFETVHPADFVYPTWARDLRQAPALWQRRWVTVGYVQDLIEEGIYGPKGGGQRDAADELRKASTDAGRFRESRRATFDVTGETVSTAHLEVGEDDPRALIEIWERWTDDHLCVIAQPLSNPIKLREEENFFEHKRKPFVDWSPIPIPLRIHGLSIIQTIYDLNEDLNTLRRQRSDAVAYSINPAWKGLAQGTRQLNLFPGAFFNSEDPANDYMPMVTPQVDIQAAMAEEQALITDIRNISGAHQYLAGDPSGGSPGGQTATGVATVTSEANRGIAEKISELKIRAMKPFGVMLASMNVQYIDEPVTLEFSADPRAAQAWLQIENRVRGDRGDEALTEPPTGLVDVDPAHLATTGTLDVVPVVGQDRELSKIQRRSDATQVVQAVAPFIGQQPPLVNSKALLEWMLRQFDVPPDERARITDTTQDVQAMMQQMMAEAQAKAVERGGEPPAESNGSSGPSGPSGPSGDELPTGGVVGAPGAAGPVGPPGMAG